MTKELLFNKYSVYNKMKKQDFSNDDYLFNNFRKTFRRQRV